MTTITYSIKDEIHEEIMVNDLIIIPAVFDIDGDRDEVEATLLYATLGDLKLNRAMVGEAMGNDALLSAEHAVRDEYEAQL